MTKEDIRRFAGIRQESENGHHGYDLGTDIREIGNSLSEFIGSVPLSYYSLVQKMYKAVGKP